MEIKNYKFEDVVELHDKDRIPLSSMERKNGAESIDIMGLKGLLIM